MPPLGRPPSPRGVYSFEDTSLPVPEQVVLDTSFVVEALLVSQPLHAPCSGYLVRLAAEGSSIVYSNLLELELAEAIFQIALKERHPKDWKRYRYDGRARRRAKTLLARTEAAWRAVTAAIPSTAVAVDLAAVHVPRLMGDFGLASYDALHVGTAIHGGVRSVVTIDAGFAAAPAVLIDLYVDGSRLATCRKRRS